jgi:hypothetical protein
VKTIHNAYINALLADAAYRDLDSSFDVGKIVDALETRMTEDQAQFIADNFDVIAAENKSDIPLLGSGFDATVWRGKSGTAYAGEVYVSFRGTQPQDGGADIEADVDLASRGVAYNQVRDMANWWMRITAKPGDVVKQIRVDSVVTPLLNSFTFAADTPVVATGELYGQVSTITGVNAHSLGGYLSTAFTRLFGAKILAVTTFNSAGFSNAANQDAWKVPA